MRAPAVLACALAAAACRDVSRFATKGDHFEGDVVKGSFVRSGIVDTARMCITLDTDHLQDAPGVVTTSDGRFQATPMRPIPQIWHDPLSTLNFGDGRVQNLVYAASPISDAGDPGGQDVVVIVSLMQSDHVEVRLLRGAPQADAGGVDPSGAALFGVFGLDRHPGACTF